ncbi:MAG: TVP38/TMEM64 family protein [Alphaproteobacteria bacterium]|nr:TVP38/TMEM64 family protein [Alphaproteobacteria bacterium]
MAHISAKIILVVLIAVSVAAFFLLGGQEYISLATLQEHHAVFIQYYDANPVKVVMIFIAGYVFFTALSLPGAAVMTLLGGALFGLGLGTAIVSIASTAGATLAFLASRFVFGSAIQQRYGQRLEKINEGIAREGGYYLFALRLVPVFPFFLVNLAMGVTSIAVWKYVAVSWLGMIPGTIAYVFAGTELAQVASLSDVLSPTLILAFVVLGLLPLVMKKAMNYWRKKQGKQAL